MSDWFHGMKRSFYLQRSGFVAVSFFLCLVSAGAVFLLMPSAAADEHSSGPLVLELSLDGEVEPILATYIDEGLADAAKRRAALVLITMDTPGGLSDSMKDMIQHILVSPVPVAVYVSPSGARGASAGFYILLSADIAAMAAQTQPGAGGKGDHRIQGFYGKGSAGREDDRSDRELAGGFAAATGWPNDHAFRRHASDVDAEEPGPRAI